MAVWFPFLYPLGTAFYRPVHYLLFWRLFGAVEHLLRTLGLCLRGEAFTNVSISFSGYVLSHISPVCSMTVVFPFYFLEALSLYFCFCLIFSFSGERGSLELTGVMQNFCPLPEIRVQSCHLRTSSLLKTGLLLVRRVCKHLTVTISPFLCQSHEGIFLRSLLWESGGVPGGKVHQSVGCPPWLQPLVFLTPMLAHTQLLVILHNYQLNIPTSS